MPNAEGNPKSEARSQRRSVGALAARSETQSCRSRGHETHSFPLKNRKKPESPDVVSYFLNGLLGSPGNAKEARESTCRRQRTRNCFGFWISDFFRIS